MIAPCAIRNCPRKRRDATLTKLHNPDHPTRFYCSGSYKHNGCDCENIRFIPYTLRRMAHWPNRKNPTDGRA
jgi:hypothetical protein